MNAAVWTSPPCEKSRNSRYVPAVGTTTVNSMSGPPGSVGLVARVDVKVREVAGADRHQVAEGAEVRLEVVDRTVVVGHAQRDRRAGPGHQRAVERDRVAVDVGRTR